MTNSNNPVSKINQNSSQDYAVTIDHVSMIFNMASETLTNLKEYAIALALIKLGLK